MNDFSICSYNLRRFHSSLSDQVEPLSIPNTEVSIVELDKQTVSQTEELNHNDNDVESKELDNLSLDSTITGLSNCENDKFNLIANNTCKVRNLNDKNISLKLL